MICPKEEELLREQSTGQRHSIPVLRICNFSKNEQMFLLSTIFLTTQNYSFS